MTSDVVNAVKYYLAREGYVTSNVVVTFENLTDKTRADPRDAKRLDHLRVTASIPYSDFRWSATGMFVDPSRRLNATVDWYAMKDAEFTINSTIPPSN